MKGFLTFTLAAGVAITTTSIAQAAGVGKGTLNADRTVSTQSHSPMSVGAMSGLTLNRSALNRELSILRTLLAADSEPAFDEAGLANAPIKRKTSATGWTF